MVRKVTPAQARQMISRQQSEQRRAIAKANAAIDKYNRDAKRFVAAYNREVRSHNARVRANRARALREISQLRAQPATTRYAAVRTSVFQLQQTYEHLDVDLESTGWTDSENSLADFAEAEVANSAYVANALEVQGSADIPALEPTTITDELSSVSTELDNRWNGALYSLSPRNPDAARHFCTSSREIIVQLLDVYAPDQDVIASNPGLELKNGKPARRSKIEFLLAQAGMSRDTSASFVEADIDDVLNLFRTFNSGTHGSSGSMGITALQGLKVRVEGAIRFLRYIATRAESAAAD